MAGRFRQMFSRGLAAVLVASTAGVVIDAAPALAAPTVGLVYIMVADGTASFEATSGPAPANGGPVGGVAGTDSGPANGITRNQDTVTIRWGLNVNGQSADSAVITQTLPVGMLWDIGSSPSACANVTYTNDFRTITCDLGAISAGTAFDVTASARVSGNNPDGTTLTMPSPTFSASNGTGTATAATQPSLSTVSTGTPKVNVRKDRAPWQQLYAAGPAGEPGVVMFYPISLEIVGGGKGAEALNPAQDIVLTDTFTTFRSATGTSAVADGTPVPSSAQLYTWGNGSWGSAAGLPTPAGCWSNGANATPFGVHRYYDLPYGNEGTPYAYNDDPNSISFGGDRTVTDSGTWSCNQPGGPGTPITVTISGSDTSGDRRPIYAGYVPPSRGGYNYALPADTTILNAGNVAIWYPVTDFPTTVAGPSPAYQLDVRNRIEFAAPLVGISGQPNVESHNVAPYNGQNAGPNPGDAWYDTNDNNYVHTIVGYAGGFDKVYTAGEAAHSWAPFLGYVPGQTGWRSGDGFVGPNQDLSSSVRRYNSGFLTMNDVTICDMFDNTWMQVDPLDANYGTMNLAGSQAAFLVSNYNDYWSRVAIPTGRAFSIEYGAVAVTSMTDLRDTRCTDDLTTWYSDLDAVPGGAAAVNVVRATFDLEPGEAFTLITKLVAKAAAPDDALLTNFATFRDQYSDSSYPTTDGWLLPDYSPANDGSGTPLTGKPWDAPGYVSDATLPLASGSSGDRMRVARAQARLTKKTVNLVTGTADDSVSSVRAGNTVTYELAPTFTSYLPVPPTAEHFYVYDILDRHVSYVVGSSVANPNSPAVAQPTVTTTTDPVSGEAMTVLRWDLGQRTPGAALPTLRYSVRTKSQTASGTVTINAAMVDAVDALGASLDGSGCLPQSGYTIGGSHDISWGLPSSNQTVQARDGACPRGWARAVTINQLSSLVVGKEVVESKIELGGEFTYRVTYANVQPTPVLSEINVIDTLPEVGDARGIELPALSNAFVGTALLSGPISIVESAGIGTTTFYYTNASKTTIRSIMETDPANPLPYATVQWCLEADFGTAGCPTGWGDVTGWRLHDTGVLDNGDFGVIEMPMITKDNEAGDVYTNRATARAFEVSLPVSSSDVTIPVVAGSISNFVWEDLNGNGLQDSGEPAIESATVELMEADGTTPVQEWSAAGIDGVRGTADDVYVDAVTTTDVDGLYLFDNIHSGDYRVQFTPPNATYKGTLARQGADTTDDSNPDRIGLTDNYLTPVFTIHCRDASGNSLMPGCDPLLLSSVDDDVTVDAGFVQPVSIGDYVWEDVNGDGIQGTPAAEPPVSGAIATLYVDADNDPATVDWTPVTVDINGLPISNSDTTGADGLYLFENLRPAIYQVRFEAPTGYFITVPNIGADEAVESDAVSTPGDPTTGAAAGVLVPSGANERKIDAGVYMPVSIGDIVWYDENGDGIQAGALETPIAGTLVTLYRDLDGDPATTGDIVQVTTDAYGATFGTAGTLTTGTDGLYLFDNLPPGMYKVRFENTDPFLIFTQPDATTGTDATDSDAVASSETVGSSGWYTLESGDEDLTVDAGLTIPASLGNKVWLDDDGDGLQGDPATEPGIDGATVDIERWDPVTSTWSTSFVGIDGQPYTTQQLTSGGGNYLFEDLVPGTYRVKFTPPAGYFLTIDTATGETLDSDADPTTTYTSGVDLAGGEQYLDLDAGVFEVPVVGDFVWEDLNGDGVQDALEPGIENVLVELLDTNGDVVGSTETAADGSWHIDREGADQADPLADELNPGTYTVRFTRPAGMAPSPAAGAPDTTTDDSDALFLSNIAPNGTTSSFQLTSDENEPDVDAGFYIPASISDLVWLDVNADGEQDDPAVETPVSGAKVTLYRDTDGDPATVGWTQITADIDGNVFGAAGTITTAADGLYLFDNLQPGIYEVRFEAPTGTVLTVANSAAAAAGTDSDAIPNAGSTTLGATGPLTLTSGQDRTDVDAGVYAPASIGDYVWLDADGDGQQGAIADEPPVEGALVTLWKDADSDPATTDDWVQVTADIDGNVFGAAGTITTDADGNYLFDNLVPGVYRVGFTVPTGSDLVLTQPDTTPDATDSDVAVEVVADRTSGFTAPVTLDSGESDLTVDAGMVEVGSISNLVWLDVDGDGLQGDPAVETGVAGATVTLWKDTDGDPATVGWTQVTVDYFGNTFGTAGTITTAADGLYMFGNLLPGIYEARFTAPAGMELTEQNIIGTEATDSDASLLDGATGQIVLGSGEDIVTVDAGVYEPVTVGNYVWEDLDADGIQDGAETGIEAVLVELIDAGGNVVASDTTDAAGAWSIDRFGADQTDAAARGLIPGTYTTRFTRPSGMAPSTASGAPDTDATDSDALFASNTAATGTTSSFVLTSGENEPDVDAGFYVPVSISDLVWLDVDGDGVQDDPAVETPVEGAKVTLWKDTDGDPATVGWTQVTADIDGSTFGTAGTITTAVDGLYLFDNLQPGVYEVRFEAPTGMVITTPNSVTGTEATDSDAVRTSPTIGATGPITLVSGDALTNVDAGLFVPVTIGDYVWEDMNGDGVQGDPAVEAPIAGAQVTLWRDADGDPATADWVQVTADQFGTTFGTAGTITTGADGGYLFDDVAPGHYEVRFTAPTGMVLTEPIMGGVAADDSDPVADDATVKTTGTTATFFVPSGSEDLTLDAGVVTLASVGDLVWLDVDGDGVQDDPAVETPVAGATVTLWKDADGDPATADWTQVTVDYLGNTFGTAGTITTDATGTYLFDNLLPGTYQVRFTPPAGMELTDPNQTGTEATDSDALLPDGATAPIVLASGDALTDVDAGVYQPVTVGDYVWDDLDADGIQDGGETGIEGVLVELLDANGDVVASTETDVDGAWSIDRFGTDQADAAARGLIPGTYTVRFTRPDGYAPSAAAGAADTTTDDSDALFTSNLAATAETLPFVLTSGEDEPDVDAGFYIPVSVGDIVWHDVNGDGLQGPAATEPPVANAKVTLWKDADGNPATVDWVKVTADIDGNVFGAAGTITTDSTGLYLFDNLQPGTYQVRFDAPAGYVLTAADEPGTEATDSDALTTERLATSGATAPITLVSGDQRRDVDAGLYIPASIGNFVWEDMDRDGVQDAGERGVANVPVILTGTDGAGNPVELLTVTDAFGKYLFEDLTPGTYSVAIAPPTAFQPTLKGEGTATTDSDIDTTDSDPGTGQLFTMASTVLISDEDDMSWDAGLVKAPIISGHVYEDLDNDGIRDPGEPGIEGVEMTLTGIDANGDPVDITVTTDETGYYLFPGVVPSDGDGYTITETHPTDFADGKDTAGTLGGDTTVNDVISGIVISSSDVSINNDFGEITLAELSGHVYVDNTDDGIFQAGEPPLAGIEITLTGTDDLGNPVNETTTTDAAGFYEFTDLRPGTYTVTEGTTPGYDDGKDTAGSTGGDATTTNDVIAAVTLVSGDNSTDNDFGERPTDVLPLTKVEGTVWLDPNRDGVRQAGENTTIPGVTITLKDADGNVVATTVTDENGHYIFDGIAPGDYTIEETQPSDYLTTSTNTLEVTVPAGGLVNQDFFEVLGSLSGHVYVDTIDNGTRDPSEPGIGGVTVRLYDVLTGNLLATTTTGADGSYLFDNLVPGAYRVVESQPGAYADDLDEVGSLGGVLGNDILNNIPLAAGEQGVDYDFGEQPKVVDPTEAAITGHVYVDANDNSDLDDGESGLGGIIIELWQGGTKVAETTTDPTGYYEFLGLDPGTYTVKEIQPDVYTSTEEPDNEIASITVAGGETSNNNDFGEKLPDGVTAETFVNGTVWVDRDGDGILDPGEPGIAGVTVTLRDSAGNVVSTTVTDEGGFYEFTGIAPGTYTITETQPTGYSNSPGTPATVRSAITVPIEGLTSQNFGEQLATIEGFTYEDLDNDGVKDAGEPAIGGVTVTLTGTDANGDPVTLTATTDATGHYAFEDLLGGTYTVTETQPAGYTDGKDTAGSLGGNAAVNDVISAITLPAGGSSIDNNFGEISTEPPSNEGSVWIGGTVYVDNDKDGAITPGDVVMPGVTIELLDSTGTVIATTTTGPDGKYVFTDLTPGADYTVREVQPAGYGSSEAPTNSIPVTAPFSGGTDGLDFGETKANLSGFVYEDLDDDGVKDPGEPGIGGVEVTLTGTDANGATVDITVTTDATGAYEFTDLLASDAAGYTVTETDPAGYDDGQDTPGSLGGTDTVNDVLSAVVLPAGGDSTDNNFGEITVDPVTPPGTVWVGGIVYYDANGNGTLDEGDEVMPGVTVNLLDADGDPVLDGAGDPITTVTGPDGRYVFTDLDPSTDYIIEEVQPGGYGSSETPTNQHPVTTPATGGETGYDFGEILATVSGHVYEDLNGDGNRDLGEPGIGGVIVTLTGTDVDGRPVNLTTTTDADGNYQFIELLASNGAGYTITETQPVGYVDGGDTAGSLGGTAGNDVVSTVVVEPGDTGIDYDFGETRVEPPSEPAGVWVGGVVYYDSNRDGVIGEGDEVLVGIKLNILDEDGDIVGTTITGPDGRYVFTGLTPGGTYTIREDQPVGYGSSEAPTNSIPVTAPATGGEWGYDFGDTLSSISGSVYVDLDNDGVRDPGELGIGGVEVTLTGTAADGTLVSTTVLTNADGSYEFDELKSGNYTVTEGPTPGYADGKDTYVGTDIPSLITNDRHAAIELPTGTDSPGYLFGEIETPSVTTFIEGRVYVDRGANGMSPNGNYEVGEPGLGGVTLILKDVEGNIVGTTVTLADGTYRFEGIVPGTYTVEELQPAGYGSSTPNSLTVEVPLEGRREVNFGETLGATTGTVFSDMNGNGVRDSGEPGIGGVTITLTGLDDRGNPVTRTTTTNPDGSWAITDLPPSGPAGYSLAETQPTGWLDGSDVSSRNGTITNDLVSGVQIGAGQIVESGNYGEIAPVSVGNFVWNDLNANGRQDAGEPGIGGINVTLNGVNDLGETVSLTTTTAGDGGYLFSGLRPGTYTITFADPAGFVPTYAGLGTDRGVDSDPTAACRCVTVSLLGNPSLTDTSSNRLDLDAGYYQQVSVTGVVFDDYNRDNVFNGGDVVRPNQTVTVQGAGPDGVIGTSDDPAPIVVTTDANGRYDVGGLPPGLYTVTTKDKQPVPVNIPAGTQGVVDFPYPATNGSGVLPRTGNNALDTLLYGFGLLGLGGVLMALGRRRRKPVTAA